MAASSEQYTAAMNETLQGSEHSQSTDTGEEQLRRQVKQVKETGELGVAVQRLTGWVSDRSTDCAYSECGRRHRREDQRLNTIPALRPTGDDDKLAALPAPR